MDLNPVILLLSLACFCTHAPGAYNPHALYQKRVLLMDTNDVSKQRRIASKEQWAARREEILAAMQRVMGPLPGAEKRVPLEIHVEREERTDHYLRRKLTYQSAPGERVPAWLLIPNGRKGRAPAMLVLHQTSN